MIIENKTPPNEPIPLDAPPSYDVVSRLSSSIQRSGPASRNTLNDEKDLFFLSNVPEAVRTNQTARPHSTSSTPSTSSSWFNLGVFGATSHSPSLYPPTANPPTPKSQADVRSTIQELVRDLVTSASTNGATWAENASASFGVLESCAAACARQYVSLSSVLQERSIEGHTPLYWAIIKRPPHHSSSRDTILEGNLQNVPVEDAVIWKLLSLSAPLTSYTLYEMRQACLATHSNDLLQRLRRSSLAFPLSGTEKMLLSGRSSGQNQSHWAFRDVVEVVEDAILSRNQEGGNIRRGDEDSGKNEGVEGGFRVRFEVETFQRRMLVSGSVAVEFIARGRLWQLTFFVVPSLYPYLSSTPPSPSEESRIPYAAISLLRARPQPPAPGMWACCLTTAPGSPQCWLDSRIVVNHPLAPETSKTPLTLRLSTNNSPLQAHNPPPYTPLPLSLNTSGPASSSFPLFFSSDPAAATMSKEDKNALNEARKLAKERIGWEKNLKQNWTSSDDSERLKLEEKCVIVEVLEESGMGKLMYDNCPYITRDGSLRATFEAHLSPRKLELDRTECIIC